MEDIDQILAGRTTTHQIGGEGGSNVFAEAHFELGTGGGSNGQGDDDDFWKQYLPDAILDFENKVLVARLNESSV